MEGLISATTELVKSLGLLEALFAISFLAGHYMIFSLYRQRVDDKTAEIERILKENESYRRRFEKLLDEKFAYTKKHEPKKRNLSYEE